MPACLRASPSAAKLSRGQHSSGRSHASAPSHHTLSIIMASPKQSHLWPPTQVALTSERCTARRCYSRQRASALPTFARLCPLKEMASLSAVMSKGPTAMGNRCRPVDPSGRNAHEPTFARGSICPPQSHSRFYVCVTARMAPLAERSVPPRTDLPLRGLVLYPLRRAIRDRNGSPNAVANGPTWVKDHVTH